MDAGLWIIDKGFAHCCAQRSQAEGDPACEAPAAQPKTAPALEEQRSAAKAGTAHKASPSKGEAKVRASDGAQQAPSAHCSQVLQPLIPYTLKLLTDSRF